MSRMLGPATSWIARSAMDAVSQRDPTIGTVIASDQTALRVGSAKLIVDGTDTTVVRKAEIALRPSRVRAARTLQIAPALM
jgi:hypothetical protein